MLKRPVTVVVLTWNGIEFTRKCLESLRANTTHPDYHVVVADNGSNDGTLDYLHSLPWVRVVENGTNLGYVKGNNAGIRVADPSSDLVLLNNDTEIHQGDWLERLQATAHAAADVGVVGCRLRQPDGGFQHAGCYVPPDTFWNQEIGRGEPDVGQFPTDREVEGVSFACVYIKREVLDAVGLLDEEYFSYFEDVDYCCKVREAGFRNICCGSVTVVHREHASTKLHGVSLSQLCLDGREIFLRKWREKLTAGRYHRSLAWRSIINFPSGYAASCRELLLALDRRGVQAAYRYLYGPGTVFAVPEPDTIDHALIKAIRARPVDRGDVQVAYGQGDMFHANDGRYKIGYTMLEVDGFPAEWVRQANQMDEVWVPSEFNRETMLACGLRRPCHVVPLGVDPNYFHPGIRGHRDPETFTFLSVFEWGERKCPETLLRAFADEFSAGEDAVLVCKVFNHDPGVNVPQQVADLRLRPGGGRVILALNQELPPHQLGSLYRSADAFVLPTRGEGWGMPILEAMACGLPVIATRWSAQADFFHAGVGYPIETERLVPAQAKCPYYGGFRWAEPSYEHLRTLLRHVYEHRDEARRVGAAAAREAAARWTWDQAAATILSRLEAIEGGASAGRRAA